MLKLSLYFMATLFSDKDEQDRRRIHQQCSRNNVLRINIKAMLVKFGLNVAFLYLLNALLVSQCNSVKSK